MLTGNSLILQYLSIASYMAVVLYANIEMYNLNKYSESLHDLWFIVPVSLALLLAGSYFIKNTVAFLCKKILRKREHFIFDVGFIVVPLLLSNFIYIILCKNNIDVRGWWVLFLIATSFLVMCYSVFFALIGLLMDQHKCYSITFSIISLFLWCFYLYAANNMKNSFDIKIGHIIPWMWFLTIMLLLIHFIFSLMVYIYRELIKKC